MGYHKLIMSMQNFQCPKCGVPFAISYKYWMSRKQDYKRFCCPNGCELTCVQLDSDLEHKTLEEQCVVLHQWLKSVREELKDIKQEKTKWKRKANRLQDMVDRFKLAHKKKDTEGKSDANVDRESS